MRFNRLDLNLLAALDVLLRTRSVSRSADEMFITQSAMSSALGRLRNFFQDPLLVQVGRRMELSPLAETLRTPLREIIMQIEHTTALRPYFDPATAERAFSIVMSDYMIAVLGQHLVRHIAAEAPLICLNLRPQNTHPGELLVRGEVDLVIMPEFLESADHARCHLFDDDLKVIACADGPYGGRALTMEEFRTAGHVVMEPLSGQESHSTVVMRQAELTPRKAVATYSFPSIPHLVRGTDMIALIQGRLAQAAAAGGGLSVTDPPIAFPPLREILQWRAHRSLDPGLTWLRDCIVSLAGQSPCIDIMNTKRRLK